ncbi:MAG: type II secretion system F family protein [Ilumatobacteraceae bacterium]
MIRARVLASILLMMLTTATLGTQARAQQPTDSVEVIVAFDASESMRPALDSAKTAANEFVLAMPADVRIGLESFADEVTVLAAPTLDRALLSSQIESIVANGDTALYDVVVGARQRFTPDVVNKVLVVLSDGKDEGSAAGLDDAVAAVADIEVETISLTTAETDLASLSALGPVTSADDAAGVSAAFARVASLLVEVIESTPTTTAPTTSSTSTPSTVPATTEAPAAPTTAVPLATVTTPEASSSSVWLIGGASGVFLGLFLLGWLLFPRERVSKARLGTAKPSSRSQIGTRTVSAIDEALERYGKRADLGETLAIADVSMKPAEFVATVAVVAVVAGSVGLLLGGLVTAVLVAIAVCLAVTVYVQRAKAKRQAAFADQLPDVLQLLTTALRSGYGLTQALESVAEDAEEPARSEFAHVLVESRMGRDLTDSMRALAHRMGSKDLEWLVGAIDINRETGGNLSEVLESVGATIRERGRIARQVRTLTAEGRLSARILIAMPLLMLGWQWRANPDNFELLTYGVGLVALVVAGILLVVGAVWVNRIVNSVAL